MTEHSKLSASSAHRWLRCSASVSAEAGYQQESNHYAEEGTAAHELAEKCLYSGSSAEDFIGHKFNGFTVDQTMADFVQVYIDYVHAMSLGRSGVSFIEQRVDYSNYVPGGFGTCDFLTYYNDGCLYVVDLKYGANVFVSAEGNEQLLLYALGAINDLGFLFEKVKRIKLAIVQPRMDNVSEWELTLSDLEAFGKLAKSCGLLIESGAVEYTPGDKQCQFCLAKDDCTARKEQLAAEAIEGFEAIGVETIKAPVSSLDPERIAELLPALKKVETWKKNLTAYAIDLLRSGIEIPGHKLVLGREGNRKWVDEEAASRAMGRAGLKSADRYQKTLISPAVAEKKLGKDHAVIEKYTSRSEAKPTYAPVSDKRPAIATDVTEGFDEAA